jgi:hypothetical protein
MKRLLVGLVLGMALASAAMAGATTVVHWPASCSKMSCVNQHVNAVHTTSEAALHRAMTPGPQGATGATGATGPKGDSGADGANGATGQAGPAGTSPWIGTVQDTWENGGTNGDGGCSFGPGHVYAGAHVTSLVPEQLNACEVVFDRANMDGCVATATDVDTIPVNVTVGDNQDGAVVLVGLGNGSTANAGRVMGFSLIVVCQ